MSEQLSLEQRVELIDRKVDLISEQVSELKTSNYEFKATQDGFKAALDGFKATLDEFKATQDNFQVSLNNLTTEVKEFKVLQDTRHEQVMDAFRELVHFIGERFDEMKGEVLRESRVLAEQTEGRKIDMLFEESTAQKSKLLDHETRIGDLEKAVR